MTSGAVRLISGAVPFVAAPMAGGVTTPLLAAAVAEAGGFPFLAAGYKTAEAVRTEVAALRSTDRPFGVDLFGPAITPIEPDDFRRYAQALQPTADRYQLDLSTVALREDDDGWQHKIDLLLTDPVPAVSVTFGVPPQDDVRALRRAGSLVLITVTTLQEARSAAAAGADALVVQHRRRPQRHARPDGSGRAGRRREPDAPRRRGHRAAGRRRRRCRRAGVLRRPPAGGRRCGRSRDAPAAHRRERSLIDSP